MRFSERNGYRSAKSSIQLDDIDDDLLVSLWNVMQETIWDSSGARNGYYIADSSIYSIFKAYWRDFFKVPLDGIPEGTEKAIGIVRNKFFTFQWFEVYDFLEFTCAIAGQRQSNFVLACNRALEREMSGYRLSGCLIVPITASQELDSIDESLAATRNQPGAQIHLQRALELLSDRQNPDFRNSIKESISAVEATVKALTGSPSSTLGDALKLIPKSAPMHPALVRGLSALYGYTSDSSGIRHALLDEPNLDFNDAKFMLVTCSSFVNLLAGKASTN